MRRLAVQQREDLTEDGDAIFWYVLKGRNGKTTAMSETYPSRTNAVRAARRLIAEIAPVPVTFSYWTGPLPRIDAKGCPRRVTEQIR